MPIYTVKLQAVPVFWTSRQMLNSQCFACSLIIKCKRRAAAGEGVVEALAGERVAELGVAHEDAALELLDRHRFERAPFGGGEALGVEPGDALEHVAELVVVDFGAG